MNKSLLCVPLFALLLQGCGVSMTRYDPNFDNVEILKKEAPLQAVATPEVTAPSALNSLSTRANPIKSPTGSIPKHIQAALTDELRLANLVSDSSDRKLDVVLVTSEVDAGMGTGTGKLAARFTVHKGDQVLYDATQQASSTWDSSFVGAVAIPAAANAYNPLVRQLLNNLYSDPLFIQALK